MNKDRYPAIQRYLHNLSSDLGEYIENITSALSLFIDVGKFFQSVSVQNLGQPYSNVSGIPAIKFSQRHGAHSLLNLSTIATFFAFRCSGHFMSFYVPLLNGLI